MLISSVMQNIKTSATLRISAKAAKLKSDGLDVISLSIGEPDFSTPEIAQSRGIEAIRNCDDNYPPNTGTKELKNEIIKKFQNDNGLTYNASEIIVSNGAKQALFQVFFALINPGDEVLLPAPYWVSYHDMAKIPGGKVITVDHDSDFKIDLHDLESKISNKTKILVLNSPNNPSGAFYNKDDLLALSKILLKHPNVIIISDDIYEHILYNEQKFYNILQVEPKLKDRTVVINGVSKCYAMTGWRIGYLASVNKDIIKYVDILQSQNTGGACSIAQAAASAALRCDKSLLVSRTESFKLRRDIALDMISSIKGLTCTKPIGAFYLFPCCVDILGKKTLKAKVIQDDIDFAEYLLEEHLVSVVPGSEFGTPGHFRLSYALEKDKLIKACNRIADACNALV